MIDSLFEQQPASNHTSPDKADAVLEVRGWASDNHAHGEHPAVVVNPKADAMSLLSWGLGQLQQRNAVLDALSITDGSHERANQVVGFLLHFSTQGLTVLEAGIDRLKTTRGSAG